MEVAENVNDAYHLCDPNNEDDEDEDDVSYHSNDYDSDDNDDESPGDAPGVEGLQQIDPRDDPDGMITGSDGKNNISDDSDQSITNDLTHTSTNSDAELAPPHDNSDMGNHIPMDDTGVGEPVENTGVGIQLNI